MGIHAIELAFSACTLLQVSGLPPKTHCREITIPLHRVFSPMCACSAASRKSQGGRLSTPTGSGSPATSAGRWGKWRRLRGESSARWSSSELVSPIS